MIIIAGGILLALLALFLLPLALYAIMRFGGIFCAMLVLAVFLAHLT